MKTLWDSAFRKMVRIFSGRRLFCYPEEIDQAAWMNYLKTENQVKDEEAATRAGSSLMNADDPETFGLYTVMSQASRSARRMSSVSNIVGVATAGTEEALIVIDWAEEDSEVRTRLNDTLQVLLMDRVLIIIS